VKRQEHQQHTVHAYTPQIGKKSRPSSFIKTWMNFEESTYQMNDMFLHTVGNSRKVEYESKTISSNREQMPRTIFYDPLDKRSYECKSSCTLFQFPKPSLEKFQTWIESKEKEGLVYFMAGCFGAHDQKGLAKLIQKTGRIKKNNKELIVV
jgi:hypothetical protein